MSLYISLSIKMPDSPLNDIQDNLNMFSVFNRHARPRHASPRASKEMRADGLMKIGLTKLPLLTYPRKLSRGLIWQ